MLLPLCLALLAHPNSISSGVITPHIDGDRARFEIELRFEARTAHELLPLDIDGDGRLSPIEIAAAEAPLGTYLLQHYQLFSGGQLPRDAVPFDATFTGLALDPSAGSDNLGDLWLVAKFSATGVPADHYWIACDLFQTTSPDHRNFSRFEGRSNIDWSFSAGDPLWRLEPERAPRFSTWIMPGFEHILSGPDHLCFVFGLMLAAAGLRQLLVTISAFTIAHSITLGLVTAGKLPPGGPWTEAMIAVSIIWVGAMYLRRDGPRRAWPEALAFGLLHGIGFAGALSQALGPTRIGELKPILGFNFGIEVGQIAAGCTGLALFVLAEKAGLNPRQLRRTVALTLVFAGTAWLAAPLLT